MTVQCDQPDLALVVVRDGGETPGLAFRQIQEYIKSEGHGYLRKNQLNERKIGLTMQIMT